MWLGSAGNLMMDKFAIVAPKKLVGFAGHVLFWPIAMSQYCMYRVGMFEWYTEMVRLPNGGRILLGGLPWPSSTRKKLEESEKVGAYINLVSERAPFPSTIPRIDIPMTDFAHPSLGEVQSAVKYLDTYLNEGKTVYVHCRAGKGRSATVVMCWLIAHMHMSPETAQEYMQRKRPQILSNLKDRKVVEEFHRNHS
jgi:protein-tyrosine phosphatase